MEAEGIGTGFWLENFGEIEIRFYYDKDAEPIITDERRHHINKKVLEQMDKIYKGIQNPELLQGD